MIFSLYFPVTLDLRYKSYEDLHFVTDRSFSRRGFYGLFEQISCHGDEHTFTPHDDFPTLSTTISTTTKKANCDSTIREQYFVLEIDRSYETCSITVNKSSEVSKTICGRTMFQTLVATHLF